MVLARVRAGGVARTGTPHLGLLLGARMNCPAAGQLPQSLDVPGYLPPRLPLPSRARSLVQVPLLALGFLPYIRLLEKLMSRRRDVGHQFRPLPPRSRRRTVGVPLVPGSAATFWPPWRRLTTFSWEGLKRCDRRAGGERAPGSPSFGLKPPTVFRATREGRPLRRRAVPTARTRRAG
jgi:hypothetical protein